MEPYIRPFAIKAQKYTIADSAVSATTSTTVPTAVLAGSTTPTIEALMQVGIEWSPDDTSIENIVSA